MNSTVANGTKGVWRGWHWRFSGIIVIALAILEVIVFYVSKGGYPLVTTGELGAFISAILIVQRVKERRVLNTMTTVLVSFAINVILQLTIGMAQILQTGWGSFTQENIIIGGIGVLFSIVYAKTSAWSDKRRLQADAQRRAKQASKKTSKEEEIAEQQRIHRVKKKRGRGRRP